MASKHILTSFDEALQRVQDDLRMMIVLTTRSLANVRRGVLEGDVEACNAAIADDDEIDQLEVAVGDDGVLVLTRFHPVASDLRQVVSAMRLCGDLERVADQAVNIARKARKMDLGRISAFHSQLSEMFTEATSLISDSLRAYENGDLELARSIKARDKKLDGHNAQITEQATSAIAQSPDAVDTHLAVIMIARHLERVGDHAKNIAENAIYAVSDEDIRHPRAVRVASKQHT